MRCAGVTRDFHAASGVTRALRGVTLEVRPGEVTLLCGPSGCGKTTLLSIVAGLLDATAGAVEVLGRDLTAMSSGERARFRGAHVGFVFQHHNLLPALSAVENAAVPLLIAGSPRAAALARARAALAAVGLEDRAGHLPAQLSGGRHPEALVHRRGARGRRHAGDAAALRDRARPSPAARRAAARRAHRARELITCRGRCTAPCGPPRRGRRASRSLLRAPGARRSARGRGASPPAARRGTPG